MQALFPISKKLSTGPEWSPDRRKLIKLFAVPAHGCRYPPRYNPASLVVRRGVNTDSGGNSTIGAGGCGVRSAQEVKNSTRSSAAGALVIFHPDISSGRFHPAGAAAALSVAVRPSLRDYSNRNGVLVTFDAGMRPRKVAAFRGPHQSVEMKTPPRRGF